MKDMTAVEKENILFEELSGVIQRFTMEYEMTTSQLLGILVLMEQSIMDGVFDE